MFSVSLVADDEGVVAHDVHCPDVEAARVLEQPICTMFDCEGDLPGDLRRHDCLPQS